MRNTHFGTEDFSSPLWRSRAVKEGRGKRIFLPSVSAPPPPPPRPSMSGGGGGGGGIASVPPNGGRKSGARILQRAQCNTWFACYIVNDSIKSKSKRKSGSFCHQRMKSFVQGRQLINIFVLYKNYFIRSKKFMYCLTLTSPKRDKSVLFTL